MSSTVSAPVFDKKKHVLLIPDLFPIHMELLANVIRASGYRVEVLRTHGADVMEAGLKYIHNDMCYPAICSLGQQLHAITSGTHDPADVAFVQFQTGGGCRASNYSMVLRKALNKLGLEIPIVTLGFSTLSRNSGFSLTPAMCIRALVAVTYGDLLLLLGNQVRPYETNPGQTQSLLRHWEETLGRGQRTYLMFLTANDREADILQGYEAGGGDYVTKPFSLPVLCRKIAAVFDHLDLHAPRRHRFDDGVLALDFSAQTATLAGAPLDLTPKEFRLLALFVKHPGILLTKGQILEQLWDIDGDFVDGHTPATLISRIRKKIETGDRKYIKTVYGIGYQWVGGEAL